MVWTLTYIRPATCRLFSPCAASSAVARNLRRIRARSMAAPASPYPSSAWPMYWTAPVLVGLRGQQDAEVLGGRRPRPRVLMLCCRLGEKFRSWASGPWP